MPRELPLPNLDHLAQRYLSGESLKSLANEIGVSRSVIHRRFTGIGIRIRSLAESQPLYMSRTTPEFRRRITAAAHDAARGKPKPITARRLNALAKEAAPSNVAPAEDALAEQLRAAGLELTQQKAVHIYNLDIAIHAPRVAVEIFGGNWHSYGRHAARFEQRAKDLLDRGWHVVIIWIKRAGLRPGCAEYLIAYCEELRRNPPARSQYRVIRGNGKPARITGNNFNDPALVSRLTGCDNCAG